MPYSADTLKKQYEKACLEQRKKNLVRLRRDIAGLSQTEFSKQTGILKPNLSCLESGDRDMSLFNIQVYKAYFLENYKLNVSTDYLLGYTSVIENTSMNISTDLGLSGKSIEILKIWNEYKKNPMEGVLSYGVADINTLNILLEDYCTLYKNDREKGLYTGYSIFHFIGSYIFSDRFKKCPQNVVKYIHPSENPEIGNPLSELKIGDTVIVDKEDRKILGIRTYDEYGSGANSDTFHIYNTENQEEVYSVKFHDIMNTYNKENIIAIIDKIKERVRKNEST